jgi:hypothetical protein
VRRRELHIDSDHAGSLRRSVTRAGLARRRHTGSHRAHTGSPTHTGVDGPNPVWGPRPWGWSGFQQQTTVASSRGRSDDIWRPNTWVSSGPARVPFGPRLARFGQVELTSRPDSSCCAAGSVFGTSTK